MFRNITKIHINALVSRAKFANIHEHCSQRLVSKSAIHAKGHKFPQHKVRYDVLSKLPSNNEPEAIGNFFYTIKKENIIRPEHMRNEKLQKFLRDSQLIIPKMTAQELHTIFVGIIHNESLRGHEINDCVKKELKLKILEFPFNDLVFFDYLIHKMKLEKAYEQLRFEIQNTFRMVHTTLFNAQNIEDILRVVEYMKMNSEIISSEILNEISSRLLEIEDNEFQIHDIKNILVLLSKFKHLSRPAIDLLNQMVRIWCERDLEYRDLELLISLLYKNSSTMNKKDFENSGLIYFVYDWLDKSDSINEHACICLNFMIDMGYWHRGIESYSKLFESGIVDNHVHAYIKLCRYCYTYNYKPKNWQTTILPKLQSFDFQKHIHGVEHFNWPSFAVQLHELGHRDVKLIETLLEVQEFYDSLHRERMHDILKNTHVKL